MLGVVISWQPHLGRFWCLDVLGAAGASQSTVFYFAKLLSACAVRMGSVWAVLRRPNGVRHVIFVGGAVLE